MPVSRRQVYYFHGFDPAATGRYRRIFAAASDRLGVQIADLAEGDGWRAVRGTVATDFHYLRYDDLVRDAQSGTLISRIGRGLRTLGGYVLDGAVTRLGPRTHLLALSPHLLFFLPIATGAWLSGVSVPLALGGGAATGLLAWLMLVRLKAILAADLFAYMRTLADGEGPRWAAYGARLPELAAEIAPDGSDEVLVVGHSLGGVTALHAVAQRLAQWPEDRALALLTLGSVHGIVLAQRGPGRDALADAIATVAADPRVTWVDVSSPRDAFTVALTDPLTQIGPRAHPGLRSPRVISAQLARAPRIPGDRRTLFAAMRRHMGYLLAPPPGAGFDYADWTTGPQSLADRIASRGNSPKARMWRG